MMKSARIVNLNVNKCPSAARIPELASASGIAPSSTPCGQMYLQKKLPSLRRRLLHPIPLTALPPNQTNPQLYSKVSKEKIWMETM
jgi:hypothetical protein